MRVRMGLPEVEGWEDGRGKLRLLTLWCQAKERQKAPTGHGGPMGAFSKVVQPGAVAAWLKDSGRVSPTCQTPVRRPLARAELE